MKRKLNEETETSAVNGGEGASAPVVQGFSIDRDVCIGCENCLQYCPVDCIVEQEDKTFQINSVECVWCGSCKGSCPVDAIVYHA